MSEREVGFFPDGSGYVIKDHGIISDTLKTHLNNIFKVVPDSDVGREKLRDEVDMVRSDVLNSLSIMIINDSVDYEKEPSEILESLYIPLLEKILNFHVDQFSKKIAERMKEHK